MDLDKARSPLINSVFINIGVDALRGDAKPVAIPPDFLNRLRDILQARGLGGLLSDEDDTQTHYFVGEGAIAHPQARQLGVATVKHTFSQFGSGETVLHEQVHRTVAKVLSKEVLQAFGNPHDVEEAICFAMEIAIFGNEKDIKDILSKYSGIPASYKERTAYLTYQFVRLYYMTGAADMIELAKSYAAELQENPKLKPEDVLLLSDDSDETIMKLRQRLKEKDLVIETSATSSRKASITFKEISWAKNLPADDAVKIRDAYITSYFMENFGLSEETAARLIQQQQYQTLRDAITDLDPVKTNAISTVNRLNTLFYLSTKNTIAEVRAQTSKVMALDMDADVLKRMSGMNDVVAQLYEVFGSDTVAAFMNLAMHSIAMAQELAGCILGIVRLCGHNRKLARKFVEKFAKDKDFREFLLAGNGFDYLSDGPSYGGEFSDKDSHWESLDFLLDARYDWGPIGKRDKLEHPTCNFQRYVGTVSLIWNIKTIIQTQVPIEVHNDFISLSNWLRRISLLVAMLSKENQKILVDKCEKKGISGKWYDRFRGDDAFESVLDNANKAVKASDIEDYYEGCGMLVTEMSKGIQIIATCLQEVINDPETKSRQAIDT